jgi:hypothetical protein
MRYVIEYKKIIVKRKGRWRYVYRPIYEDKGKGAGLEKARNIKTIQINKEVLTI